MKRFLAWRGHSPLALLARLYLGWVFLAACLHKIAHPADFALDIATYDILPLALINPMAIALPYLELATAIMLFVGFRVRAAALAVSGMMFMFIVALILALVQGLDMSCGCFASGAAQEDPIGLSTVMRDLGWLSLSLYVLLCDRKPWGVELLLGARRDGHES